MTVNCSSPWKVKLDGPDTPQTHVWIFDVRIQVNTSSRKSGLVFESKFVHLTCKHSVELYILPKGNIL